MSTNDTTHGPTPQFGAGPAGSATRLTRSRDDRVIAGVCGGLGRYARVDPVIFRIVLVVLAFFGGIGLLLYLIGWLALAEDGDTASPIEALFGRGRSSTNTAVTVVLFVLALAALGLGVWGNRLALLALVVLAGVLLVRHTAGQTTGQPPGAAARPPAAAPPDPQATSPQADAATQAQATAQTQAAPQPHAPPFAQGAADTQAMWSESGPTQPFPAQAVGVPYAPQPTPRARSPLGRIVLSIAALVSAGLVAADLAGAAAIPADVIVGCALAVVTLGLLIGAVFGRARWLVAVALALTLALGGLGVSQRVGSGVDAVTASHTWAPVSVTALRPTYEIGAGTARLDLRKVNFAGQSKAIAVHVGAGSVAVVLPPTVDVLVHGRVGLGQLRLFAHPPVGGADSKETVRDYGSDGPGGGRLNLYADAGVGAIHVVRR